MLLLPQNAENDKKTIQWCNEGYREAAAQADAAIEKVKATDAAIKKFKATK